MSKTCSCGKHWTAEMIESLPRTAKLDHPTPTRVETMDATWFNCDCMSTNFVQKEKKCSNS